MQSVFVGCPADDARVPFETKDINMSEYLQTARAEKFIGRQWLYREVEDTFKDSEISGVLVIGNPGTGKSAFFSHLICSRTSSSEIHAHVLGYHLCKYSDKNTQMAGKFVRNLAEMIARRLPEYGYLVSNSSYIQRSFDLDCIQNQDPVGCFEQTILTPLRSIKNKPLDNWFIVLDALDECLSHDETSYSIIYLLQNKINRFPSWLKLIITSRNQSDVSLRSSKIKKVIIDPDEARNLEDIEIFIMTRLYQESPLLWRVRSWFGDDSVESTSKLAAELLSKSQGNFQYVTEVLHHWEISRHELKDAYALPRTLADTYHSYFERLYSVDSGKGSFRPVRHILELLVSSFEPLTQKEIFEVLKLKEKDLDEEYDFKKRLKELDHFLNYGKNNTVTLHHLSLTEWLTSAENEKFFVSIKKGHEVFCDYYFTRIRDGDKGTLSKDILTLAQHIAFGGLKDVYVQEFLNFPSKIINSTADPQKNRSLLHLAATINSTDALKLLLRHFSCIDCADNRGITPAFLAAKHGLLGNLALLVKKGAKINRKTNSIIDVYKASARDALRQARNDCKYHFEFPVIEMPLSQTKSKLFDSSMLHAAAQGGHISVVRFLLENNALISMVNGAHLTAIQIAAENGHLEVVKTLYESGAIADQTALHHAAANNRLDVVNYLLDIGVKDECLPCNDSFYWLNGKRRIPSSSLDLVSIFSLKQNCSHVLGVLDNSLLETCIDWNQTLEDSTELHDDKHLILCHTALHAASASGYVEVVSRLISEEHNALNCHDYSGRTPFLEAVGRNNTKIVDILIKKQRRLIQQKCIGCNVHKTMLSFEEAVEYHADICQCGYSSLHLAARYGYKQLALSLIRKGARVNDQGRNGATPVHEAACHNQPGLILLLTHPNIGGDINSKTRNGSTPLHSAAVCGAVEVIDYLLYMKANRTALDDYGLTALHYSILNIKPKQPGMPFFLNESRSNGTLLNLVDRRGHLSAIFKDKKEIKNADRLHWLDTLLKLIIRGSDVDAVDRFGRTALHYAAYNGLADAVNVLLKGNATSEKQDKDGKTPLELAVENAPIVSIFPPYILASRVEGLQEVLHDHGMVVFLLLFKGASFRKCNRSGSSLLHRAISNEQPYIVQLLLLKGASLTCKDSLGRTPLITYLQHGGKWIDTILNDFITSVDIKCEKPFKSSVFHLLSYRPPTSADSTFFDSKQCNECNDPGCKAKKGPLAEAIERHPREKDIINSCFDAEGFTPLHRAAQGANLVAIRYLLANGANDSILSPSGHDALTLAVLHAGSNLWRLYGNAGPNTNFLGVREATEAAIELLHHGMNSRGYKIICDSSEPKLTLYHLAASRGLAEFIEVLLNESHLHQLDVDCPNLDGITPMYLATMFGNKVSGGLYNPWRHVVEIIESYGGRMQYPDKNTEYNVIFSRVYGWIPNDFTVDLRPDILHFITSLLTSYEKAENKSFLCSFDIHDNYHFPFFNLEAIWDELIFVAIKELSGQTQMMFREEYKKQCSKKRRQAGYLLARVPAFREHAYLTDFAKGGKLEILNRVQRNWFHKQLFNLMQLRHVERFRSFACAKSLSYKFKLLYAQKLNVLIQEYEKTSPHFYLKSICEGFDFVFRNYLSHMERISPRVIFHGSERIGRPSFVNERIKILTGRSSMTLQFSILSNGMPLEFLVKRFFSGVFRRYDYLRTLNVGIEPYTHVQLYPEKTWRIFRKQH